MHDRYDTYDHYGVYDEPEPDRRLLHLVFLDGRLVDSYPESVAGSPYSCMALEADAEARRRTTVAPARPDEPEHERMLAWLDMVAGGRRALLDLDAEPLEDIASEVAADHPAYDAAADLLERTALQLFGDAEVWAAAHHVLDRVWTDDESLLAERRTVPQVVGGVLWVVGRANGLFGQAPAVRQKDVQHAIWLRQSLATTGQQVERCLRRLDLETAARPYLAPSLTPYGDASILTSTTRSDLLHWRDRALDAQRRHRLDEAAKREALGVLPPEVES